MHVLKGSLRFLRKGIKTRKRAYKKCAVISVRLVLDGHLQLVFAMLLHCVQAVLSLVKQMLTPSKLRHWLIELITSTYRDIVYICYLNHKDKGRYVLP